MPMPYTYSIHTEVDPLDQIRLSQEFNKYKKRSVLKITVEGVESSYIFCVQE